MRIRFIAGVVLLLLVGTAAVRLTAQASQSTIIQRVLVKVNGEPFTQKDLEQAQIEVLQQTGRGTLQGEALTAALTEMMPGLILRAIDDLLLYQRGREAGYTMSNEQFEENITLIKQDNSLTDAQFTDVLRQEGLTLDDLRKRLSRQWVIQEVQRQDVLRRIPMTEQEMRQYYDSHPDEFMKPANVTLREVLVAVPVQETRAGQPPSLFAPNTDQAARQRIEALRERARTEDFATLVAEASESPSKASGGLIGPVTVSELSETMSAAIATLEPGQVTDPIRTPRGYQIFKLDTRSAAEAQPFDAVRDDIATKIGQERLDTELTKYLQRLRAQAYLDWKRPDLQQMYERRLAEIASTNPQ